MRNFFGFDFIEKWFLGMDFHETIDAVEVMVVEAKPKIRKFPIC